MEHSNKVGNWMRRCDGKSNQNVCPMYKILHKEFKLPSWLLLVILDGFCNIKEMKNIHGSENNYAIDNIPLLHCECSHLKENATAFT